VVPTVIGASAFSLVSARQNADLIISENMSEFNPLGIGEGF